MNQKFTFYLGTTACCLLLSIALSTISRAQVRLVEDINASPKTSTDTKSFQLHESDGGRSFFVSNGGELWTSDGTTTGTKLVKRFLKINELEVMGEVCYFSGETEEKGAELWKSDGTAGGTSLLKDIYTGRGNSSPLYMTKFNGMLYFSANHNVYGRELWKTDGTSSGTQLVADISPGGAASNPRHPKPMGSKLFFSATTPTTGTELWSSNGTAEGTSLVKDIRPGTDSSSPTELGALDGWMFFAAFDSPTSRQLWKSDGTPEGTTMVKVINPGRDSEIGRMTPAGGLVFFEAAEPAHGLELWRSDGTAEGTFLLKDFSPGPLSYKYNLVEHFSYFTSFNGKLLFQAYSRFMDTWVSDGTIAGTKMATPPNNQSIGDVFTQFYQIGDAAYFVAESYNSETSKTATNLYKVTTDGQIYQVRRDLGYSFQKGYFAEVYDQHGLVYADYFWRTDGTPSGSTRVRTLGVASGSDPRHLQNVNGTLYFEADAPDPSLWKSNGTEETTEKLFDVTFIDQLASHDNVLLFTGTHNGRFHSLWRTDGSTVGTYELEPQLFFAHGFTSGSDRTYFTATTAAQGYELWSTDGTDTGTRLVRDINPGKASSNPSVYQAVGNYLYFNANNGSQGMELWRTNGIDDTYLVKDINPGTTSSYPMNMVSFNGKLFFQANDGVNGYELWQSDGSSGNTSMVKNIRTGDSSEGGSDMGEMTTTAQYIFFGALNEEGNASLWRSNGTTTGTVQFQTFEGGLDFPQVVASTDDLAFFFVEYSTHLELWGTNGSSTMRLANFRGQRVVPYRNQQVAVKGNVVYFITSYDGQRFLWRTDGTYTGTYQIKFDGNPDFVATSGPYVYLSGTSQKKGSELFTIDEATSAASKEVVTVVQEQTEEIVKTYPNPFTNTIKVLVNGVAHEKFSLELLDARGRKVVPDANLSCNIEHQVGNGLPEGTYIIKVQKDQRTVTRRVVKAAK